VVRFAGANCAGQCEHLNGGRVRSLEWLRAAKQRAFPKGVRRWAAAQRARVLDRTSERDFRRCFEKLKIAPGSVICVHAAMSGFGYLADGMASVFSALRTAVPDCTVVMPSFPFGDSTAAYLQSDPVFDRDATPSQSGALSEVFRRLPDVRRGYHPTHACLALGPQADSLIDGTEWSRTPFGDDSTYGRYSRLPNTVLLLLHTNSTSHVHRLQELVSWPNLFLPGLVPARGYDSSRQVRTYEVCIHRPRLPLYAVLPATRGDITYLWLPDYAVQFPAECRQRVLARLGDSRATDLLTARQESFVSAGIMTTARCGHGEVMAIDLQPWQTRLCDDLRQSFAEWPDAYSLERLTDAGEKGLLG